MGISRRDFVKSSSIISLSSIAINDPYTNILKSLGNLAVNEKIDYSLVCDFFRPSDLLHLKFYFYNAKKVKNKPNFIERKYSNKELFVYVQTPSQHIAEELELNSFSINDRRDFKPKKSFLSGSSWIALKLKLDITLLEINPSNLLDWSAFFSVVTIDDFSTNEGAYRSDYTKQLFFLKNEFDKIRDDHASYLDQSNMLTNSSEEDELWPISKFELPYKLYLSPIASPYFGEVDPGRSQELARNSGDHIFLFNNNDQFFELENNELTIIRPWGNEMVFETLENEQSPPRFKALTWTGQDNDSEPLLPEPDHRRQLTNLTMIPNHDRDILSRYFKISAYGGSTYLKYKNNNPLKESIVGWEQDTKYARDNYVSITVRAVDVFTGLKLLISVVAERLYKHGVSFLQKRYFVSYAEKEKVYDKPVVISKTAFEKIIPQNTGMFFSPIKPDQTSFSYIASKEGKSSFNCEDTLIFEYIGIDRKGISHPLKLKMIFIPAETYTIKSGTFTCDFIENPTERTNTINSTVPITEAGALDPSNNEEAQNSPSTPRLYTYAIEKTFGNEQLNNLKSELEVTLKNHIKDNYSCYKAELFREIAYAKLENLKSSGLINKNSSAETFETSDMLFLGSVGETSSDINVDSYNLDFPIAPYIEEANVVISQIDQIEGTRRYRKVRFAKDYFDGNIAMDEESTVNRVKLLFELIEVHDTNLYEYKKGKITNFFTKNFESAGASANLGIPISHVSILDQGITFNESHNNKNESESAFINASNQFSNFSSASVFSELDAEIFGISLLDIVQQSFPVDELPVFNYIKEAQQSMENLEIVMRQVSNELKTKVKDWKGRYDTLKVEVEKKKSELEDLNDQFRTLRKNEGQQWLESLISQFKSREFFIYQQKFLQININNQSLLGYYNEQITSKIFNKINSLKDLSTYVEGVISAAKDPDNLSEILKKTTQLANEALSSEIKPIYLKEAVRIYSIGQLINGVEKDYVAVVHTVNNLDFNNEQLIPYYNNIVEGLKEANAMAEFHINNEIQKISDSYNSSIESFNERLQSTIVGFTTSEQVQNILQPIIKLSTVFEEYQNLYKNLKLDYYKILAEKEKLDITDFETAVEAAGREIENQLINQLKSEIATITAEIPNSLSHIKTQFESTKTLLESKIVTGGNWIRDFDRRINEEMSNGEGNLVTIKAEIEKTYNSYEKLWQSYDLAYRSEFNQVKENLFLAKRSLKSLESELKNYVRSCVEDLKKRIDTNRDELIALIENGDKNSTTYKTLKREIDQIKGIIRKLELASKQSLSYKYNTTNFRRASLGGVIDFEPNQTELNIDVRYDIEFDISKLDRLPTIKSQNYVTESTFTNFKLSFLKLIYVDFERVNFIKGSSIKDNFEVRIRDVQFAGSLSFVEAFQQFLSNISDNLIFELNAQEARIGFGFSIPSFTAGYFNFFNFNLAALIILPFDPKRSLQFRFGFGTEYNKFGITVAGIFGGQGYFNLIAEPKRGIVGMILVLEFGAIFSLNLGPAAGTAYLVGGIFIKRYKGEYELRGYILCVGRFNVLGLFSASMSFYLGLEGNGQTLYGSCRVTVSKRFSRFFKISVSCTMRKTIKGAKDTSEKNKKFAFANLIDNRPSDLEVFDINKSIIQSKSGDSIVTLTSEEDFYMTLSTSNDDSVANRLSASLLYHGNYQKELEVKHSRNDGSEGVLYFIEATSEDFEAYGLFQVEVKDGDQVIYSPYILNRDILDKVNQPVPLDEKESVLSEFKSSRFTMASKQREYFQSYFVEQ